MVSIPRFYPLSSSFLIFFFSSIRGCSSIQCLICMVREISITNPADNERNVLDCCRLNKNSRRRRGLFANSPSVALTSISFSTYLMTTLWNWFTAGPGDDFHGDLRGNRFTSWSGWEKRRKRLLQWRNLRL